MTIKEQNEYWLKFHRFQQRYEKKYIALITAVLKAQVQSYIKHKDTIYVRSGEMHGLLLKIHQQTGAAWAYHTRGNFILKRGGQMGFSERIFALIRQYFFQELFNTAEDITQTTIRLIQDVLTRAAETGASFDDMVKELEAAPFSASRARLIARTETVAAANQAAIINARASGIALDKIWIAARDNRTRKHHAEINQTTIPLSGKFLVGGFEMDVPGDKAAGPGEVCNCRCVIGFIPI